MSGLSAYRLAKLLGLSAADEAALTAVLEQWKKETAGDARRTFWLFERAAESLAESVFEKQHLIALLERFHADAPELTQARQELARLLSEFKGAYAMASLLKLGDMEAAATAFVEQLVRQQRKKIPGKPKKEG